MVEAVFVDDDDELQGLRLTQRRMAILEVLRSTSVHPEASWVYEEVRKTLPHISLGTVYRNLAKLAEAGLVMELKGEQRASHWDGRTTPHGHVVCNRCGKIVDLEIAPLTGDLESKVAEISGFTILGHRLQFEGVCPECKSGKTEPKSLDGVP